MKKNCGLDSVTVGRKQDEIFKLQNAVAGRSSGKGSSRKPPELENDNTSEKKCASSPSTRRRARASPSGSDSPSVSRTVPVQTIQASPLWKVHLNYYRHVTPPCKLIAREVDFTPAQNMAGKGDVTPAQNMVGTGGDFTPGQNTVHSTPEQRTQVTPPVQPSISPEIHSQNLDGIEDAQHCFGAGHVMAPVLGKVGNRRKCRPCLCMLFHQPVRFQLWQKKMGSSASNAGLILAMAAAVTFILAAAVSPTDAQVTCPTVTSSLSPCLSFFLSGGKVPDNCCDGVIDRQLTPSILFLPPSQIYLQLAGLTSAFLSRFIPVIPNHQATRSGFSPEHPF